MKEMDEGKSPQESQTEKQEAEPRLLGSAETQILDTDEDRIYNIRLAAEAVDGAKVLPGEVFSFNAVVGPRTEAEGYREATVLVGDDKESDCGGGVCQLSTTIYQAAEASGMKILERHDHKKDVGYAPIGVDAAVDYETLDMRFCNGGEQAVLVRASVSDGSVRVQIYEKP